MDPADGITRASAAIRGGEVHTARKLLKRLRALATLVGAPKEDRRALRDAGRLLAGARDAEVLAALLEVLASSIDASNDDLDAARRDLAADVERTRGSLDTAGAEGLLVEVAQRLPWPTDPTGFRAGYRAARKGMPDQPVAEAMHEWRKAVKRHWHHCEELGLDERAERLHELSDLLGDDHDLHVLGERLPHLLGLPTVIAARQSALREQALALGAELFADKPEKASKALLGSLNR